MIHGLIKGEQGLRWASGALLLASGLLAAHDIPNDVTVHVYVKPEGEKLQVLVRMPLRAIRDVDFPVGGEGYVKVAELLTWLPDMAKVWMTNPLEIYESGVRLAAPLAGATQLSVESDRSFVSFEDALAHVRGPKLAAREGVVAKQLFFDAWFEYPIRSERSEFAIRPGMEGLAARVLTIVRFLPPGGGVRAYEFLGDPGVIPLDPRWLEAVRRFVALGFSHILDGTDHLLFLLCLVIPFRQWRPLVVVVTAFTVAHSITLIASAYRLGAEGLWFPPLIETLIAASIVWMSLENIAGAGSIQRRWLMAFGFGLVHGFGFSFVLQEQLQFAGGHLLGSLVAFNVGVELGQLLVLLVLIPVLALLFRWVVAERMGTILLSALVAHTGWHWMTERAEILAKYPVDWWGVIGWRWPLALGLGVAAVAVGAWVARRRVQVRAMD